MTRTIGEVVDRMALTLARERDAPPDLIPRLRRMGNERMPDVPHQPGDGDRKARDLKRLRGRGDGALTDDREPDVVEIINASLAALHGERFIGEAVDLTGPNVTPEVRRFVRNAAKRAKAGK